MVCWFHLDSLLRGKFFQWYQPLSFASLDRQRTALLAGEEMFQ
jgi:hypothetical protein